MTAASGMTCYFVSDAPQQFSTVRQSPASKALGGIIASVQFSALSLSRSVDPLDSRLFDMAASHSVKKVDLTQRHAPAFRYALSCFLFPGLSLKMGSYPSSSDPAEPQFRYKTAKG